MGGSRSAPKDVSVNWRRAPAGNRPTTVWAVVQSVHRPFQMHIPQLMPRLDVAPLRTLHTAKTWAELKHPSQCVPRTFPLGLRGKVRRGDPPPHHVDINNPWTYYFRPNMPSWHTKRRFSLYQQQPCIGSALHPGLPNTPPPPAKLFRSSRQLTQAEKCSVHPANPSWPWTLNSSLRLRSLLNTSLHIAYTFMHCPLNLRTDHRDQGFSGATSPLFSIINRINIILQSNKTFIM
jgi:hypothetical protein